MINENVLPGEKNIFYFFVQEDGSLVSDLKLMR